MFNIAVMPNVKIIKKIEVIKTPAQMGAVVNPMQLKASPNLVFPPSNG
jgi:hypothetical protein